MGMSKAAAGTGGGFCGVPLPLVAAGVGAGAAEGVGAGVGAGEAGSPATALAPVVAAVAAAGFTSGIGVSQSTKFLGKRKQDFTFSLKPAHARFWEMVCTI